MRRQLGVACVIAGVLTAMAVLAAPGQQPEAVAVEAVAEPIDITELMRQMGAPDDAVMMVQLVSEITGLDPGKVLLLEIMHDELHIGRSPAGMLVLMQALAKEPKRPPVFLVGDGVVTVEDGVVRKIDLQSEQVTGSVAYRPKAPGAAEGPALADFLKIARQRAVVTHCRSNVRQLCTAALVYSGDWDGILPGEAWPDDLEPYAGARTIYRCPAAGEREIGFALNEALVAARADEAKRPEETVLFFEADVPADAAFGGPEAVVEAGRHDGKVMVGFLDGHVETVTPERARELLARDPFR